MSFRKALVTGCCGFIGSHLTRMLVNEGWYVEGVDDLSNGDLSAINDLKFRAVHDALIPFYKSEPASGDLLVMTCDFAAPAVLERVASKHYDVVFHLAANPRVEFSVQNPALTTNENVQKTVELMSAARQCIDRFVFAASSAAYGNGVELPTSEDSQCNPTSPYGLQKLVIEQFGKLYSDLYEMDFAALRFFNVYGPGQDGSSPYSTAISAWCTRLKKGEPLRSDGDGLQSRDLVYVEDVASALVKTANHPEALGFEVFNVGSGEAWSNKDVLDDLTKRFPKAEVNHAPARTGDVKHTLASIDRINDKIGWSPTMKFWDGLEATLRWWELT
jgi:nucleoside-diphosphate-sugar epimerase